MSRIVMPVSVAFYLAGAFHRRTEFRSYAADLIAAGHTVTSTWLAEESEIEAHAAANAKRDLADLDRASAIICFTTPPRSTNSRGGRHTEFGYALGQGKAVILVGPRENIFYALPGISVFDDWPSALRSLQPTLAIAA
jgi:nucleoside 2-deoxyribosyltransferase